MPDETPPIRVVVELVSSGDVKRLEDADKELHKEIDNLRRQLEGLHRQFYELLEVFGKSVKHH